MNRSPILVVFAFLAVAVFLSACGGSNSNSGDPKVPDPTFTGALHCQTQEHSKKGVTVCSASSIDASKMDIIDQQLDDVFKIAENGQSTASGTNNYHRCPDGNYHPETPCFSTHQTYFVWLIPKAPACVSPGFTEKVSSPAAPNGYDETYTDSPDNHWDKDPRAGSTLLCVAGFMATGGGQMKGVELPGMAVVDAVDAMPIVRYEAEHNILAQVDQNRYGATQYHYGDNGGHPILGDGTAGLKQAKPAGKLQQGPKPVKDDAGHDLIVTK